MAITVNRNLVRFFHVRLIYTRLLAWNLLLFELFNNFLLPYFINNVFFFFVPRHFYSPRSSNDMHSTLSLPLALISERDVIFKGKWESSHFYGLFISRKRWSQSYPESWYLGVSFFEVHLIQVKCKKSTSSPRWIFSFHGPGVVEDLIWNFKMWKLHKPNTRCCFSRPSNFSYPLINFKKCYIHNILIKLSQKILNGKLFLVLISH